MRDIEGIEDVLGKLQPHWDLIEAHFERENAQFKALMAEDHDILGQVLKCHLVVEHYLDRFLSDHFGINNISSVKLSFFQKAKLLPDQASAAAFVKPGILRLNQIRNRFGHRLSAELDLGEFGPITEILDTARNGVKFEEPIDALRAFTTVASTFLVVPPPNLQDVFMDAFSMVRVHAR